MSQKVLSATWEMSTIIPRRFISSTTCFAEVGESVVVLDLRVVNIAGGISPLVGVRPRKRHVAHAETVEIAKKMNIVLDGVTTFDSHQGRKFFLLVGALDVIHGKRHHHSIRMARCLLVDGIDQIEGVLGEVALIGFRFDPDGKELSAQVSGASFVKADVAEIFGIGRTDIEVIVEKTLRRVSMCVDDNRRIMYGESSGSLRLTPLWPGQKPGSSQGSTAQKKAWISPERSAWRFPWIARDRLYTVAGREEMKS